MIVAIVIGSVAAYIAIGGVVYGVLEERRWGLRELPNDVAAAFWPITLSFYAFLLCIPIAIWLPVRLGRRLARPRPQLPEARVVSTGETHSNGKDVA